MHRHGLNGWFTGTASIATGAVLFLTAAGCETLPEPKVSQQAVLEAAKQVIAEKYPVQNAVSHEGGYVVALSPVRMDAATKTRKQISVIVKRNYTGNYDPDVHVRLFEEVGTPYLKTDPESPTFVHAAPLQANKWRALDELPYEAQSIYDAILEKLQPKGI